MLLRSVLLISSLQVGILKADIDITRLPPSWERRPSPPDITAALNRDGQEVVNYFVSPETGATLMHMRRKLDLPYNTASVAKVETAIRDGVQKGIARAPDTGRLRKNEILEQNGLRLIDQQLEKEGVFNLSLSQVCVDKVEAFVLSTKDSKNEALLASLMPAFLPVDAPERAPIEPRESSDAYRLGGLVGKLLFWGLLAAVFIRLVVRLAGKPKKPGKPRKR